MQSVVAVTEREDYVEWLNHALADVAEVVVADQERVDRAVHLVDAVGADVVFVQLGGGEHTSHTALIEGILAAKPQLAVAALGDDDSPEVVLAGMRAGARDFLRVGSDIREVQSALYRLQERTVSRMQDSGGGTGGEREGEVFSFLSARPYEGVTTAAIHTALALQEEVGDEPVLLLDLGTPPADSLLFLDLKSTYTFVDAVRSVRRFDHTLIKTAFTRHRSGLTLLSMPEEPMDVSSLTPADVMILFNLLRSYFRYIVVHLGGAAPSEFVQLVLSRSDRTLLVAEQAVPSAHASKRMLDYLASQDHPVSHLRLLVDRYSPEAGLEAEDIAEVLGLSVEARLPSSGLVRLQALNSGRTIFEEAPRDPYSRAIRDLAKRLSSGEGPETPARSPGWLQRLLPKALHG